MKKIYFYIGTPIFLVGDWLMVLGWKLIDMSGNSKW